MGNEALQFVLGLDRHTDYAGRLWISGHGKQCHAGFHRKRRPYA